MVVLRDEHGQKLRKHNIDENHDRLDFFRRYSIRAMISEACSRVVELPLYIVEALDSMCLTSPESTLNALHTFPKICWRPPRHHIEMSYIALRALQMIQVQAE